MAGEFFSDAIIPITEAGITLSTLGVLARLGLVFNQTVPSPHPARPHQLRFDIVTGTPIGRAYDAVQSGDMAPETFNDMYTTAIAVGLDLFSLQYPELGPYEI